MVQKVAHIITNLKIKFYPPSLTTLTVGWLLNRFQFLYIFNIEDVTCVCGGFV